MVFQALPGNVQGFFFIHIRFSADFFNLMTGNIKGLIGDGGRFLAATGPLNRSSFKEKIRMQLIMPCI
ncbi:hypothetical protein COF64_02140 [Bacillus sp. AFS043905]|nr:hypothetical protein COF64_02140 [Bacillus sp. AFS043905]